MDAPSLSPSLPPSLVRSAQEFDLTAAAGLGIPGRGREGEREGQVFMMMGSGERERRSYVASLLLFDEEERFRGELQSSSKY